MGEVAVGIREELHWWQKEKTKGKYRREREKQTGHRIHGYGTKWLAVSHRILFFDEQFKMV